MQKKLELKSHNCIFIRSSSDQRNANPFVPHAMLVMHNLNAYNTSVVGIHRDLMQKNNILVLCTGLKEAK